MLAVSLVSVVSPAAVRLADPAQPCMQVARRPAAHVTVTYCPPPSPTAPQAEALL